MTEDVSAARPLQPRLDTARRLSPEHEEIVRATLPAVGANIAEIAATFYRRMFAARPELLADTFNRGNQAQGAQQKALAASVASYATILVAPEGPSPSEMLGRIGHKHASLGIVEDQYGIVHEHLMAAIGEVLGEAVTEPVAAAWSAVYWHMAETLISFEKDLYAAAGVEPGDVFREAVVAARVEESSDVASFELISPAGGAPLPDFVPGQYVTVGVRLPDGARQLRQYSLSDVPGGGRWRISVRRVDAVDADPRGEVSTWLHENVAVGDRLQVTLPFGDLALDTDSDAPVVLVSAGIGATPILGMLRYLAVHQRGRRAIVLHADADARDAALVDELARTVAGLPPRTNSQLDLWFAAGSAEHVPGGAPDPRITVHEGRMALAGVPLPEDAEIYLCGGSGFLKDLRDRLRAAGADEERVHFELFSPNDWLLPA